MDQREDEGQDESKPISLTVAQCFVHFSATKKTTSTVMKIMLLQCDIGPTCNFVGYGAAQQSTLIRPQASG
jgi:hypothetical protein